MSTKTQQIIASQMAGNAITRVTLKKIKALKFPKLALDKQQEVSKLLKNSFEAKDLTIEKLKTLKQLKNSVINNHIMA